MRVAVIALSLAFLFISHGSLSQGIPPPDMPDIYTGNGWLSLCSGESSENEKLVDDDITRIMRLRELFRQHGEAVPADLDRDLQTDYQIKDNKTWRFACSSMVLWFSWGYNKGLSQSNPARLCIPSGVDNYQLMDVVSNFLKLHPEIRQKQMSEIIPIALKTGFGSCAR